MTEPNNTPFMEWVEQYANDTISPKDAEKLLEIVKNDPEKLEILRGQLQIDRLLEITRQRDARSSIAEIVLERAKNLNSSSDLKKVRRSRTFLKIAASLTILIGLSYLMIPKRSGISDRAAEIARQTQIPPAPVNRPTMKLKSPDGENTATPVIAAKIEADASQHVEIHAQFVEFNEEALADLGFDWSRHVAGDVAAPVRITTTDSTAATLSISTTEAEKLVPLEITLPKPLFSGTPKQIRSKNLEKAPQYAYDSSPGVWGRSAAPSRETYATIVENEFNPSADKALSTFSIDVDTASYANVRRYLTGGSLPPPDAVRLEEMINYFDYDYEGPTGADPLATSMALSGCPWNPDHQLLRIGLQGRKLAEDDRKESNLVFLLDVSGSMNSATKLPLLKKGFEKMVRALGEKDRVAIVVYAGSSGVVLDSTSALEKEPIIGAMNRLKAGGSTAGGQGIELAYKLATDHFIPGGVNRVILATDGDFNVGVSNLDALQKLIEEKRKSNVFLSVLGFGTGNLQDAKMEMLANKGNGNYFYIDSEREAEKVLVKQLTANLVTIAKDVKIQVEFNPALVRSYRLIGYENRKLAARDFADDTKDAGEIGAGHQVTALYELVPASAPLAEDGVPLKYANPSEPETNPANESELLTLKLRYKQPEGAKSKLLTFTLNKNAYRDSMDASFRWATSVAAFGMHLRASNRIGSLSMEDVIELARSANERDPFGYRRECLELMNKATKLRSGETNTSGYPEWKYR